VEEEEVPEEEVLRSPEAEVLLDLVSQETRLHSLQLTRTTLHRVLHTLVTMCGPT